MEKVIVVTLAQLGGSRVMPITRVLPKDWVLVKVTARTDDDAPDNAPINLTVERVN